MVVTADAIGDILSKKFAEVLDWHTKTKTPAKQVAKQWHRAICAPLDDTHAKYAKALRRILGTEPTVYQAIQHRDHTTIQSSEILRKLFIPLPMDVDGDEKKADAWRTMQALSTMSFLAAGEDVPRVPMRAEIEANIKEYRASKRTDSTPNSTSGSKSAFIQMLVSLSEMLPQGDGDEMRTRLNALNPEERTHACDQWCNNPFSPGVSAFGGSALTASERKALLLLPPEQVKPLLLQLNDLANVQKGIPAAMMGRIEEYAAFLGQKIHAGNASLESLDLQKIGEDCLRTCSEEDISALASNIHTILPSILPAANNLQQTMASGIAGVSPP